MTETSPARRRGPPGATVRGRLTRPRSHSRRSGHRPGQELSNAHERLAFHGARAFSVTITGPGAPGGRGRVGDPAASRGSERTRMETTVLGRRCRGNRRTEPPTREKHFRGATVKPVKVTLKRGRRKRASEPDGVGPCRRRGRAGGPGAPTFPPHARHLWGVCGTRARPLHSGRF